MVIVKPYSVKAFVTQNYEKPHHTTITEIFSKYSIKPHHTTTHPQNKNRHTHRERVRERERERERERKRETAVQNKALTGW